MRHTCEMNCPNSEHNFSTQLKMKHACMSKNAMLNAVLCYSLDKFSLKLTKDKHYVCYVVKILFKPFSLACMHVCIIWPKTNQTIITNSKMYTLKHVFLCLYWFGSHFIHVVFLLSSKRFLIINKIYKLKQKL